MTGAFLGLISIMAILILSLYFFVEIINRQNLSIIYNKIVDKNASINFTGHPYLFSV